MNLLYNASIGLFAGAARIAALRSDKIGTMLSGQAQAVADVTAGRKRLSPEGYDLWVHAASLGEFEQARPMIERLLARRPEAAILLTFFSPSGYTVRSRFHERVQVAYLPFDRPSSVAAFLDAARPRMAVFVKYEFWGNYLDELSRRGIPTYIISAIFRPGQIFFRPWGGIFRKMLHSFRRLYVQDEASRKLLAGVGVDNVTVAGDTRFDRVSEIRENVRPHAVTDAFVASGQKRGLTCMVFGSSWPSDENVYMPWLTSAEGIQAIIAPHEFDAARIAAIKRRLGSRALALSEVTDASDQRLAEARFLIIDCFGLLSSLYGKADFAYVGGGFGAGLHNINEAAAFGIPVIYGPNNRKFKEAADLLECGGGFCVRSESDFRKIAGSLLADKDFRRCAGASAGNYIASHIGATDIIMADLFPDLK